MAILDRYSGFVLDLDSAPWRGAEVSRDALNFLRRAQKAGLPIAFVTNDSSRSPHQIAQDFDGTRVTVEASQIITSAAAAATLVSAEGSPRTLVIGGPGLLSAMAKAGVEVVEDPADADTVVVGWHPDATLAQLRVAAEAIEGGARFIGTAPDPVIVRRGERWPGPGSILALLREATGVAPEMVGKPNPMVFEQAAEVLGVDGKLLIVGDGVETDLAAANRLGWDTALIVKDAASHLGLLVAERPPAWVVPNFGGLVGDEPPSIRHARAADLSAIHRLLADAGFEQERAAARVKTTLVAEAPGGDLVGTASWEVVSNAAHLRGVTTARKERGHGTATLLVTRALMELRRSQCEWVYLLTPGAESLFETLGFYRVQRDRVPDEILETAQFGGPADKATALVRRLR